MLRGQDILLALKILCAGPDSFSNLGRSIGISASQAHAASKRAIASGLLRPDLSVRKSAVLEALLAVKFFIPAKRGGEARGIPTAHSAPALHDHILEGNGLAPVWPHDEGLVRGLSCEPIYRTAPMAAMIDSELYAYLALIDSLRIGGTREQNVARKVLSSMLGVSG